MAGEIGRVTEAAVGKPGKATNYDQGGRAGGTGAGRAQKPSADSTNKETGQALPWPRESWLQVGRPAAWVWVQQHPQGQGARCKALKQALRVLATSPGEPLTILSAKWCSRC